VKPLLDFVKTIAAGGLFVVLPLLLFYLLLREILGVLVELATPIADVLEGFLPEGIFENLISPPIVALGLLLAASLAIGLAMRSDRLTQLGRWLERMTLERVPMYSAVRSLVRGFSASSDSDHFRSALLSSGDGALELVYLVEEHDDGLATVLVPWAPAAFAGSIKIVPRTRLEVLPADLGSASRVISHWGVGMRELLSKRTR